MPSAWTTTITGGAPPELAQLGFCTLAQFAPHVAKRHAPPQLQSLWQLLHEPPHLPHSNKQPLHEPPHLQFVRQPLHAPPQLQFEVQLLHAWPDVTPLDSWRPLVMVSVISSSSRFVGMLQLCATAKKPTASRSVLAVQLGMGAGCNCKRARRRSTRRVARATREAMQRPSTWMASTAAEYVNKKSSQDAIVASAWPDFCRAAAELAASSILDLGCGDGEHSARIAEALPGATVVGADMSPGMIEGASERSHARLSFVRADAEDLPPQLCAGRFDVCCSYHCLHWPSADAAPRILGGIAKALRPASGSQPGGRFVAAFHGAGSMEPLFEEIRACLVEGGQPPGAFVGLTRFTASGYEELLRAAGFRAPASSPDGLMVRLVPFQSEMRGADGVASRLKGAWGPMLSIAPPASLWEDVGRRFAARHGQADGTVPLACQILRVDAELAAPLAASSASVA